MESVTALEFRRGEHLAPQGCFALLKLGSGCIAQLESSWSVPDQAPATLITPHWQSTIDAELAVVGTSRTARLQGGLQIWTDQLLEHPDLSLWPQLDGQVHGALQAQLQDFLACVRTGTPSAIASLSDAVEGLRVAEAVIASARLGTRVDLSSCA